MAGAMLWLWRSAVHAQAVDAPPATLPPPVPPYCYYKCYGYDSLGLKTVRLFSNDVDYFSAGTCLESNNAYTCGPTKPAAEWVVANSPNPALADFSCSTTTCNVKPPPPSPPPSPPGTPPFESGYADAGAWAPHGAGRRA